MKNRELPKGLYLDYKSRYRVKIYRDNRDIHVGTYDTIPEALEAKAKKEKEININGKNRRSNVLKAR